MPLLSKMASAAEVIGPLATSKIYLALTLAALASVI